MATCPSMDRNNPQYECPPDDDTICPSCGAKLPEEWVTILKRTNDPKLTWITVLFSDAGIPWRRNGDSFHAPIVEVRKEFAEVAWLLLGLPCSAYGIKENGNPALDDIEDDHPHFSK